MDQLAVIVELVQLLNTDVADDVSRFELDLAPVAEQGLILSRDYFDAKFAVVLIRQREHVSIVRLLDLADFHKCATQNNRPFEFLVSEVVSLQKKLKTALTIVASMTP